MGKHAYLIMAHHRPDVLRELLKSLDDSRNDIYVHIDIKSSIDTSEFSLQSSNLRFIDSMDVRWGGFSQIECELNLYESAHENGPYDYYHLLTGSSYPLKSNNDLHDFYDAMSGYEFIGYDNSKDYSERVKYTHLFNELGKEQGLYQKALVGLRHLFVFAQKAVGRDRLLDVKGDDGEPLIAKKGSAYTSLTEDFVAYLLSKRDFVREVFKNSLCCDEVFVQTIAFNSEFRDRVFSLTDEWNGCKRACVWECHKEGPVDLSFAKEDLDYLVRSDDCFAFKFEGDDALELIRSIEDSRQ